MTELKKIKTMYLSHPLKVRHEVREMELEFEKNTGIKLINPFYDPKGEGKEREDIKQLDSGSRQAWSSELPFTEIVEQDIYSIDHADGVVAWCEKTVGTIGTYMEIWHGYLKGKVIFVVTPDWENHPWLKYCAIKSGGAVVKSFKELESVVALNKGVPQ